MVEAYKKRNGIKEEDITTTEDLDDLYSAAGHRMAENPEAWH